MCTDFNLTGNLPFPTSAAFRLMLILLSGSVQVNIPAESGEMGILANHVPSIEQLKPGLIEIIEESGGSKQFFCAYTTDHALHHQGTLAHL